MAKTVYRILPDRHMFGAVYTICEARGNGAWYKGNCGDGKGAADAWLAQKLVGQGLDPGE